jgi:hypothetical protein
VRSSVVIHTYLYSGLDLLGALFVAPPCSSARLAPRRRASMAPKISSPTVKICMNHYTKFFFNFFLIFLLAGFSHLASARFCFFGLSKIFFGPSPVFDPEQYNIRSKKLLEASAVQIIEEVIGPGKLKYKDTNEINWELISRIYINRELGAWRLSLYPDTSLQRLALLGDPSIQDLKLQGPRPWESLREWVNKPVSEIMGATDLRLLSQELLLPSFRLNTQEAKNLQPEDSEKTLRSVFWASLWANPISPFRTSTAVKTVFEDLAPKTLKSNPRFNGAGQSFLVFKKMFENFLGEPKSWDGLRRSAKKILQKLNNPRLALEGDLFSDLLESYLESSVTPAEAVEFTWNTVALISTKGPGVGSALAAWTGPQSNPLGALLSVVSHGANILDTQRQALGGRSYSFPPDLMASFVTGKSYHFWMTAFLARKVTLENKGDTRVGFATAWITELGYQFGSRTVGRHPEKSFTENPLTSDYHFRIRMDLALAAAGAAYGSNKALGRAFPPGSLNADLALKLMEQNGKNLPAMSFKQAEIFYRDHPVLAKRRWLKIFAPEKATQAFELSR